MSPAGPSKSGRAALEPAGGFDLHVSVHDVMPATLDAVARCLTRLESAGLSPVDLLVVPGRDWDRAALGALRAWVGRGHRLAGHGWAHRAVDRRSAYHRLHAALISRDVAEHLSRPVPELVALVHRCHGWFTAHGLPAPTLYVPPAWALGGTRWLDALPEHGFRRFETLTGVHDRASCTFTRFPLLGFEADTAFRARAVRASNALALALARRTGVARLAIHPNDFELRLAGDLEGLIGSGHRAIDLDAALERRPRHGRRCRRHRRFTEP